MDLQDRFIRHDAWTTRQLLDIARSLSDEQLDQDFDIGLRSLRATFLHIVRNIEIWTHIMLGGKERPEDPGDHSIPALAERLDEAAARFETLASDIRARGAWDEQWIDHLDDPPTHRTYAATIAHVVTHSMHHRAQILYMLRRLGVEHRPEGDVLSWESAQK